jgi:hypothetical protein
MLANPVTRANNMQGQEAIGKLSVNAYPNPSGGLFTLQLQSAGTEPLTMYVTDVSGRIIETRTNIVANGSLQLGSLYHPGVYYVQVVQGSDKVMLNLVKQ